MPRINITIRYFYDDSFIRWTNLDARAAIGPNQLKLLTHYRKLKTATPEMVGMTVTAITGQPVGYAPILPRKV